ncbi:MAG TPA: GNAT family N-acetyltransferase [Jatrophihabitans sp.]|jgi:GNAT superfamily N-acetyltransferase|nr:GNAT family N-acetyltransferase [Jatrophihabitans sp.]
MPAAPPGTPETYAEQPRGYASLWAVAAVLGAGLVIDLMLGGGVPHLIGWAIAFVLVLGVNALVVHAVRETKSLNLTRNELRVGDEAIDRTEITGIATDASGEDLPVLGWPTGRPRGMQHVTLRLIDGRDLVVPTRFPDRLRAALGVATAVAEAEIRAAARADLPLLEDVYRRAAVLFRTAGYALPDLPFDAAGLAKAKAVFVAGRPPIAFVRIDEVDGLAHIDELAVIPKHMRHGVGGRLVERACEWAREHGYPAITLTTYADVLWNGPFYAARGFEETAEHGPGTVARRDEERKLGLDAVGRRIVMRRGLD